MNVYTFETNGKINKDTTISLLSDFHFNDNTSESSTNNEDNCYEIENCNNEIILIPKEKKLL